MIRNLTLALVLFTFSLPTLAATIADVEFNNTININENTLQLNGVGTRSRFFITIYAAALYVEQKQTDAANILSSNSPVSLSIEIVSGLVNKEKMSKAITDGFEQSTQGNTAPIQSEINQLLAQLESGVEKKDRFDFSYIPDIGTIISKNGEQKLTIKGNSFKQAFFGIWISKYPVQKSLKKALLGK